MDELAHRLRKHRLAARFSADADLIVGNGVGKTLGYTRLRTTLQPRLVRRRSDDVTLHTCRHTFASILIDQGADVEFVSDQLGHSSTKTTWDIYVHLFRARDTPRRPDVILTPPSGLCCVLPMSALRRPR